MHKSVAVADLGYTQRRFVKGDGTTETFVGIVNLARRSTPRLPGWRLSVQERAPGRARGRTPSLTPGGVVTFPQTVDQHSKIGTGLSLQQVAFFKALARGFRTPAARPRRAEPARRRALTPRPPGLAARSSRPSRPTWTTRRAASTAWRRTTWM